MPVLVVAFGALALLFGAIALGVTISTVVVSLLWGWFVTPTFGMAVPPWPVVAGLSLLVGWFTHHDEMWKDHETDWVKYWSVFVLHPVLVLLVGWVLQRMPAA